MIGISTYILQNRPESQADSLLISTSLETDYIPFFAGIQGTHKRIGDFRYTIYHVPKYTGYTIRNVQQLNDKIFSSGTPYKFIKLGVTYYVMKHLIYTIVEDKVVILYSLIMNKNEWRDLDFVTVDHSKFKILISSEFVKPEYKAMYTHFTKNIINDALLRGVDIIHTNDITRYCFRPIDTSLKFRTIAEMKDFFHQTTQTVIDAIRTG
jgi:hypothetical protein